MIVHWVVELVCWFESLFVDIFVCLLVLEIDKDERLVQLKAYDVGECMI